MTIIDQGLLDRLLNQAENSERKRINYDLRTKQDDNSQRMLNAMQPGTLVSVHRHPYSDETVVCLKGKLEAIFFEESSKCDKDPFNGDFMHKRVFKESHRELLSPTEGLYEIQIPAGTWHTVHVIEPTVIIEMKDGRYGEDGSVTMD